jgi:TonB family protein
VPAVGITSDIITYFFLRCIIHSHSYTSYSAKMKILFHPFFLLLFLAVEATGQEPSKTNKLDTATLMSSDEIFQFVDSVAMPMGGYEPFYRYIGMNLRYPKEARVAKITGKVIVEFVVEKDGSISPKNIKILKSPHDSLSEEAQRIIKNAPDWIPGKIKGIPVRSKKVLPITFNLG